MDCFPPRAFDTKSCKGVPGEGLMGAVVWRNLVEGASPSHSGLQNIDHIAGWWLTSKCRLIARS